MLYAHGVRVNKFLEVSRQFSYDFHEIFRVLVVLARDMNGHVGSSNAGYDGTHGGFGYGSRNADGSRILEFADRLNLVICNTLFTKQESQLVTYAADPVLKVQLIILLCDRKTKQRFVMSSHSK